MDNWKLFALLLLGGSIAYSLATKGEWTPVKITKGE